MRQIYKANAVKRLEMNESELTAVNQNTLRDFTPEEIFIFRVRLCDNEVDRDLEFFPRESLEMLKTLFVGKTMILDHQPKAENQVARIYDTELEDLEGLTQTGEPYCALNAKCYMVRNESSKDMIAEIEAGIKKEVSVGCSIGQMGCSICHKAVDAGCTHRKGEIYGEQVCYRSLEHPTDAYEVSFVAVPAQRNAGVVKYTNQSITTKEEQNNMTSKDQYQKEQKEKAAQLAAAFRGGDNESVEKALVELSNTIQGKLMQDAQECVSLGNDERILAQRGIRQLTSKEKQFYKAWLDATNSADIRKEIAGIEKVLPETVLENVFEDIRRAHPLLDLIQFRPTAARVKMVINTTGVQLAAWGKLGSAITKKLEASLDEIDTGLYKLTAFMPVSKDFVKLGPAWLDRFVREILTESVAAALEVSIISGTGKDEPIGMDRDLSTTTNGEYAQKTAVALNDLTPESFAAVLGVLTKGPNDKRRNVNKVIMIVNPVDYLSKIFPATTIRSTDGTYRNDVLPFPTQIIQSEGIEEGKAVIGLANRYFMAISQSGREGVIEYSDEYQFLEDNRVYTIRLYATGRPLDENAFVLLDISGLRPANLKVEIVESGSTGTGIDTQSVKSRSKL